MRKQKPEPVIIIAPAVEHSDEVARDDGQLGPRLGAAEIQTKRKRSQHATAASTQSDCIPYANIWLENLYIARRESMWRPISSVSSRWLMVCSASPTLQRVMHVTCAHLR